RWHLRWEYITRLNFDPGRVLTFHLHVGTAGPRHRGYHRRPILISLLPIKGLIQPFLDIPGKRNLASYSLALGIREPAIETHHKMQHWNARWRRVFPVEGHAIRSHLRLQVCWR